MLVKLAYQSLHGNFEQPDSKMNEIKYSLIVEDIKYLSETKANILYLIEWLCHKIIQEKRFWKNIHQ